MGEPVDALFAQAQACLRPEYLRIRMRGARPYTSEISYVCNKREDATATRAYMRIKPTF